jgi:hypothetical protein
VETIAGLEINPRRGVREWGGRDQLEVEIRPGGAAEPKALGRPRRLDAPSRVDVDPQPHRPFLDGGEPKQLAAPRGRAFGQVGARAQRQGVSEPNHARCSAHLGHEHTGVGYVELPRREQPFRGDGECPTPRGVEDPTEQRRGVKARDTQPRDGAVSTHEGRRRAVAHEAVVLDRQVAVSPVKGRESVHDRSADGRTQAHFHQ